MNFRKKLIQKLVDSKTIKRWNRKYSAQTKNRIVKESSKVAASNKQPAKVATEKSGEKFPLIVDHYPKILNIELTNKCIMKCSMYPRTYSMTRKQGSMSLRVFKKIIDEYVTFNPPKDFTTWVHHFGESLLHPKFDKAIEYAVSKGVRTGISLNPLALTEKKAVKLFKAKPSEVYFMVDGSDNESFEKARGVKNAYDVTVQNAIRGIKIKEKFSPDTKLQLTAVDNPAFKKNVDEAEKFWKEKHNIAIQRKPFSTWNGDIRDINNMTEVCQYRSICNHPWSFISITWDGLVVACCADYNNLCVLGDIKTHSLKEIWNNPPAQKLREELRTGNVENRLCKNCFQTKHNESIKKEGNAHSYSQFGEDLALDFIITFLINHNIIKDVTYLDIGANEPKNLSNTYFLYKKGYSGVAVEPNRYLANEFKKCRPMDKVLEVGIHVTNKEIEFLPFYQFNNEANGLSTFSKKVADQAIKDCVLATHYDVINTKVIDINKIVKKYFNDVAPTLVSLDVEGIDYEILRSFDFDKCRPVIWCIETMTLSSLDKIGKKIKKTIDFMLSKNYVVFADTYVNTIFIDKEIFSKMT